MHHEHNGRHKPTLSWVFRGCSLYIVETSIFLCIILNVYLFFASTKKIRLDEPWNFSVGYFCKNNSDCYFVVCREKVQKTREPREDVKELSNIIWFRSDLERERNCSTTKRVVTSTGSLCFCHCVREVVVGYTHKNKYYKVKLRTE